jgi:hypothetical protein
VSGTVLINGQPYPVERIAQEHKDRMIRAIEGDEWPALIRWLDGRTLWDGDEIVTQYTYKSIINGGPIVRELAGPTSWRDRVRSVLGLVLGRR